jgi:hypothetical protein
VGRSASASGIVNKNNLVGSNINCGVARGARLVHDAGLSVVALGSATSGPFILLAFPSFQKEFS